MVIKVGCFQHKSKTRKKNGSTIITLHLQHTNRMCLQCSVSILPSLKQNGKVIFMCRGQVLHYFSPITFRKLLRMKKSRKTRAILLQEDFFLLIWLWNVSDGTSHFLVWNGRRDYSSPYSHSFFEGFKDLRQVEVGKWLGLTCLSVKPTDQITSTIKAVSERIESNLNCLRKETGTLKFCLQH